VLTNFSIDEDAESGDSNIPLTLTFEKVRFVAVEKTTGADKAKQPKKVAKKVKKGVKTPSVKDCVAANSNVINISSTISEVRLPQDPRPFSGTFSDIAGDFR